MSSKLSYLLNRRVPNARAESVAIDRRLGEEIDRLSRDSRGRHFVLIKKRSDGGGLPGERGRDEILLSLSLSFNFLHFKSERR